MSQKLIKKNIFIIIYWSIHERAISSTFYNYFNEHFRWSLSSTLLFLLVLCCLSRAVFALAPIEFHTLLPWLIQFQEEEEEKNQENEMTHQIKCAFQRHRKCEFCGAYHHFNKQNIKWPPSHTIIRYMMP